MAKKNQWTIHPGHEDYVYVGNIPDGKGGLAGIYKAYKDFTQNEMMRLKAWSPTIIHIHGPVLSLSIPKDNKPNEKLPKPPKKDAGNDKEKE